MHLHMNPRQAERWAHKRSCGPYRFVLVQGVLLFGGALLVLWAAMVWLTASTEYFVSLFLSQPMRLVAVVSLVGAAWGLVVWNYCEFRFRRTQRKGAHE